MTTDSHNDLVKKNQKTGFWVFLTIFAMIGLSFASVPLYRLFCQVTGFGGTPSINPNAVSSGVIDRTMTIRFNADTAQGMPWTFHPEKQEITVKIGQTGLTSYYAKNNTSAPITGTAIYNVLPEAAGEYFHKTQCFCFGLQTLKGGQEAHMPVVFFVDPKINEDPDLKEVKTITLSYTFFKADTPELERALEAYYTKPAPPKQ